MTLQTTLPLTRSGQIAEKVGLALGYADTMQGAERHIRQFPLVSSADNLLAEALNKLDQAKSNGRAALTAIGNASPIAEVLGHVQAMDTRAKEAIDLTRAARTAAGSPAGLAWLDTPETAPPGPDEPPPCHSYGASVDLISADGAPQAVDALEWTLGDPGEPARLRDAPSVSPKSIYASTVAVPGAPHVANIEVVVVDRNCRPVRDGTPVRFSLDDPGLGTFEPITATTTTLPAGQPNAGQAGVAKTALTASTQIGRGQAEVRIAASSLAATTAVILVGPPGRLNVLADRSYIYYQGAEVAISADVRDANNRIVADGTQVAFNIQPPAAGVFQPGVTTSRGGIASVQLRPNGQPGPASIQAQAGAANGVRNVVFVGLPVSLTLTARPPVIRLDRPGSHITELTAEVKDASGQPAPDGTPVTLTLADPDYGLFLGGDASANPPYSSITTELRDGGVQARLRAKGKVGKTLVLAQAGGPSGPDGILEIVFRGYEVYLPAVQHQDGRSLTARAR